TARSTVVADSVGDVLAIRTAEEAPGELCMEDVYINVLAAASVPSAARVRRLRSQCAEKTVVFPFLSNARTWYRCVRGPSIPGDPAGIPGTASPAIFGFCASRRSISSAETWPSIR